MPQTLLTGNALFEAKASSKIKDKLLRSFFHFSKWNYIALTKLFHEKYLISCCLQLHVLSVFVHELGGNVGTWCYADLMLLWFAAV